MMQSKEDLGILIRAIDDSMRCSVHLKDKLEVCVECGSVLCMGCRSRGCQCSNDE